MQTILPPAAGSRCSRMLSEFFRLEAAGGIVLIAAAALAMVAANSRFATLYENFRGMPVQVRIGELEIAKPLLLWINDGLMAVFFLLVALEIKRETLSGTFASRSQLILPVVCAVAGVAVPALLFAALNYGSAQAMRGWAVPTATDIAFALGVLALLGSRVPIGMKLLLSTIAVVDDLIAILIIATFYSNGASMTALGCAAAAIAGMWFLNHRGVRQLAPYLLFGVVLWVCVLKSGVHATLAGVVTGLMIPHRRFDGANDVDVHSPLETLEHSLHPWVAYAILPLFAFANAGLVLSNIHLADMLEPIPMGVLLGLVVGKPVSIVGAAMVMRMMGWAKFPDGMGLGAMIGLGILCGVGFTMSLFIASLAYTDPLHYGDAALGVLVASLISAVAGGVWLRAILPPRATAG